MQAAPKTRVAVHQALPGKLRDQQSLRSPRSPPFAFGVEIDCCAGCGGRLKVIASIEEPELIAKILAHLQKTAPNQHPPELPLGARAPPRQARLI